MYSVKVSKDKGLFDYANGLRSDCLTNSGTGIIFFFGRQQCINVSGARTTVIISNSVLTVNSNDSQPFLHYQDNTSKITSSVASGLSIIAENTCSFLNVQFYNTRFEGNVGISSSLLIINGNSIVSILFEKCVFQNNIGSGVDVQMSSTNNYPIHLSFDNCLFRNHSHAEEGGAISIRIRECNSCSIQLKNFSCEGNSAIINGDCVFVHCSGQHCTKSVNITLENVNAQKNGYQLSFLKGLFAFHAVSVYLIGGSHANGCVFEDNFGSSALFGYDCDVYLKGNILFYNNQALSGAALYFIDSFVNCIEGLSVSFNGNTAKRKGGAIHIISTKHTNLCSIQFYFKDQFTYETMYNEVNFTLQFTKNKALIDANSVYAYPIYNCYPRESSNLIINSSKLPLLYSQVFRMPNNGSAIVLKSLPESLLVCGNKSAGIITTYPGKLFQLESMLVDGNNNSIYGDVYLFFNNSWSIKYDQLVQPILPGKCNIIYITIFSYKTRVYGDLTIQLKESRDGSKLLIFVDDCPHGLIMANDTCICHPLLSKYKDVKATCNAENGTISIHIATWIGLVDGKHLAVSDDCPLNCCERHNSRYSIPVGRLSTCLYHHEGIRCGSCEPGYSTVFGVKACQICSNYWLLTIFGFGMIGIALIFVLFKLKISISTGWFNAMVFYANMFSLSAGELTINGVPYAAKGLVIWLNLLNLDLGFPLCFYNGMTETVKAMLQFGFPLYLISLVIVFIVISRYSTRMSRMTSHYSVQVLATLIFLSYSKITITVTRAFEFAKVEVENNTIMYTWYEDGNVRYFKDIDHCILGVVAILVLICAVLPYTILLTVLPFMYRFKWVNRIRPFLDAHYGPYKDKYQWWFGLRLWILFLTSALSASISEYYRPVYLLTTIIVILVFVLAQAYLEPLKNKYINVLEIVVMTNWITGAIVVLTSFTDAVPISSDPLYLTIGTILIFSLFFLFWAIVIGHVYSICKFKNLFKGRNINITSFANDNVGGIPGGKEDSMGESSDHDSSYKDYREPLLADIVI